MEEKISEFQVGDILPLALTICVAGIGISYTLSILSDVQDDMTPGSNESQAVSSTIVGVKKFADKFGLISTVLVAAILLGILVRYLMVQRS